MGNFFQQLHPYEVPNVAKFDLSPKLQTKVALDSYQLPLPLTPFVRMSVLPLYFALLQSHFCQDNTGSSVSAMRTECHATDELLWSINFIPACHSPGIILSVAH